MCFRPPYRGNPGGQGVLSKGKNGRRNRKETLAGSQHHIDELIERVMIEESRGWRGEKKTARFTCFFALQWYQETEQQHSA